MPFARPTLTQLRTRIQADLDAGLPGVDTLLRYAVLRILGIALAGLVNGLYGFLDWIAKQSVPFTATDEFLAGWAALKGVILKAATQAKGQVVFSGSPGATPIPIDAGTVLIRSDGAQFTTDEAVTLTGSTVLANVTAAVAGSAGNTAQSVTLSLATSISGVNALVTTNTAITGGADVENQDDFRSRMIQAYSNPAQGGSQADYEQWATAIAGVTRAWCTPNAYGSGTVEVLFMMDDANATEGGFPQGTNGVATAETRAAAATGDQLTIANALYAVQPVPALVFSAAPAANTVNLTIAGLGTPSTTVQAAIASAFSAALQANAVPGGTTNISAIEAAIASVSGSAGFVITTIVATAGTVTPGAAGNIISNAGALPVPGTITYAA